jgi:hypothetical protein
MVPFIPDVDYHIQALFIVVFAFIWTTAFTDDYLQPTPKDPEEDFEIT